MRGPTTFQTACRPARAPSWPAVAWLGGEPALAFYDGEKTRVMRVPDGASLERARVAVSEAGDAGRASPGLGARADGALLATIEGPAPAHRLLVQTVGNTLDSLGTVRELATSVDPRYAPAVLPFGAGWLVGWIDASGETGRALVRVLARDGAPLADAQVLSEPPTGAAAIALSSHGDHALAAWIDPHLGFSPLSIAWSDPQGQFAAPRIVTTTGSIDRSAVVQVAAGPADSGLLIWGHVGGLGQDYLSRTLLPHGADAARPQPLSRVDAYAALRAAVLSRPAGWGVAWDSPTAEGRAPPTTVTLQWLDETGASSGAPVVVGPGSGVTAATASDNLALAFRRGMSACVATASTD